MSDPRLELVQQTRTRIERLLANEESQRVPDDAFVESWKRELRTLDQHTTQTDGSADAGPEVCVVDNEPMPCFALSRVLDMYQ